MENKGFIKERRAGMYESKLQELLSMDEILRVDPQCAEQACKGLCTGALWVYSKIGRAHV